MSNFRHWHRNRLLKLVKLLQTKKVAAQFDLETWVNGKLENLGKKNKTCNTTACAVGWAATIPQFRKAGLKVEYNADYDDFWPSYKENMGFPAVEDFFGLSSLEAHSLFHPFGYDHTGIKPKEVAAKIKLLLKEKK